MNKSTTITQKKSDEKRGLKVKSIKMHIDTITLLEKISDHTGKPQNQVVTEALELLAKQLNL